MSRLKHYQSRLVQAVLPFALKILFNRQLVERNGGNGEQDWVDLNINSEIPGNIWVSNHYLREYLVPSTVTFQSADKNWTGKKHHETCIFSRNVEQGEKRNKELTA